MSFHLEQLLDERTALASSPALQLECEFETFERAGHGASRESGHGAPRESGHDAARESGSGHGAPRESGHGASHDARCDDDRYLRKDVLHDFHGCHKKYIAKCYGRISILLKVL